MSLIAAAGLGKHYGTQVCFQEAEFTLDDGARVGLIGANGAGKTSLLRILLGDTDHDGTVTRRKGLRLGALEQEPRFPEGATVHEAVIAACGEVLELERRIEALRADLSSPRALALLGELEARFDALDGYAVENRAQRILDGLGFPKSRHGDDVAKLSGGERSRLAFARLLVVEPDVWLLDEPTNHLDLSGILFLEDFLRESRASAIIVSHDRHFLDAVTTETWEIEAGRLWRYPASYSTARTLRDERIKAASRGYERQREEISKQEAFIDRYRAGQRARQAAGRLKRLERLERLDRPVEQARLGALDFPPIEKSAHKVVALSGLAAGFGERALFTDLSLEVGRGETVGIVGPNGAGKTTLLRVLLGEMTPSAGTVRWGERVRSAHIAQHERDIDPALTPMRYIREAAPRRTDQELRDLLAAMLFRGDEVERSVSVLSGGERKRLVLTRLLLEGHNVLLLDEPTNHLDLPSREALELALSVFEGTVVIVSHDRYLLDRLCDRVLWMEDGTTHQTSGGFEEALVAKRDRDAKSQAMRPRPGPPVVPVPSAAGPVPAETPPPVSPYARLRTPDLEERIIAGEERLRDMETRFADPAVYRDADRMRAARDEVAKARAELRAMEREYEGRSG